MRLFGKMFYSDVNDKNCKVRWELDYVKKELDKGAVLYHVQELNAFESVLWFEPSQVPFLPLHLGVNDYLDSAFNKTLPGYNRVYFHRIDTVPNLGRAFTTSANGNGKLLV